jgi:nicotinate-nucleotide adenylyltransferase
MKIGLFGGTFDPVHFGHLRAALEVKEGFGLTQVFLIPAAMPPHKTREGVAATADRLRMIELAAKGEPGLMVSDVEIRREGPSYTIDTVRHFRRELAAADEIFLIMGRDAFLEIDTWKSFRELLALVAVIVITRPDAEGRSYDSDGKELAAFIHSKISPGLSVSGSPAVFNAPGIQPVTLFPVTAFGISSSQIRGLVNSGRSVRFLVPGAVQEYIQTKGLYS